MSNQAMHGSVLAIGVFDLFHIGHLRYLQYARTQGKHLSVAISPDVIVYDVKQKSPTIQQDQRMEIIRGLGWVDFVGLLPTTTNDTQAATQWIEAWGIDHVVVGGEWSGSARWNRLTPFLAKRGISVGFAPHTAGISTSRIVEAIQVQSSKTP
jgi:cytidyltransferase-like protein